MTHTEACIRGCKLYRRHLTDCPLPDVCRGCLPRRAEYGHLCWTCHRRLERMLVDAPIVVDWLTANLAVGESQQLELPTYVYVASSWRNPMQQLVVETLRAASIDCYDFRNPDGGTGFSWSQVKTEGGPESLAVCAHCGEEIARATFAGLGFWEPDCDAATDTVRWRHKSNGYAACRALNGNYAIPKKGSDWEDRDEYLRMLDHPRAREGFAADFAAMQRADTFVMVLPCGKSAHLELGWATGAGKRTAILLEDPVEPELMYLCADYRARNILDLLGWLGVQD